MTDTLDDMIAAATGPVQEVTLCNCGSDTEEALVVERVPIGDSGDYFDVEVPVTRCLKCKSIFRDARSESIRHLAACRYLGILSPQEVRAVRQNFNMSRKAFGESFGIPPSSMERWENGKLLQNKSSDNLLRALLIPGVAERLIKRAVTPQASFENVVKGNFAALAQQSEAEQQDALKREDQFKLRVG